MALSDYERKMLEELENQLSDEDPSFAEALAPEGAAGNSVPGEFTIAPRNLVLGLLIIILGLGVMIGGVAIEQVLVGILGVAVIFAGFWYLSNGIKRTAGKARPKKASGGPAGPSFMEKQAQEWLRRMQEGK